MVEHFGLDFRLCNFFFFLPKQDTDRQDTVKERMQPSEVKRSYRTIIRKIFETNSSFNVK